jgi:hypothetical protein
MEKLKKINDNAYILITFSENGIFKKSELINNKKFNELYGKREKEEADSLYIIEGDEKQWRQKR